MKKIISVGITLLLFVIHTKAQSTLGIDTSLLSYSYVSSTSYNNVDAYTVSVFNYGPQVFTGNYQVIYAVDSANTGNSSNYIWVDSSTVSSVTILVNASLSDSVSIPINPTSYRQGLNTVISWPRMISTPFTPYDSLKLQVLVMGFAGIDEKEIVMGQKLFPNPAKQLLFIQNHDRNFVIEQVRFLNIEGKLLYTESFKGLLDVSKLPPGFYLVDFVNASGKTNRYKVIKE